MQLKIHESDPAAQATITAAFAEIAEVCMKHGVAFCGTLLAGRVFTEDEIKRGCAGPNNEVKIAHTWRNDATVVLNPVVIDIFGENCLKSADLFAQLARGVAGIISMNTKGLAEFIKATETPQALELRRLKDTEDVKSILFNKEIDHETSTRNEGEAAEL